MFKRVKLSTAIAQLKYFLTAITSQSNFPQDFRDLSSKIFFFRWNCLLLLFHVTSEGKKNYFSL